MAINKSKLFSGEVRIYVAEADTPLPEYDDTTGAVSFDSTAWFQAYTTDEVTLTYSKEVEPVKVNGILGNIKNIIIGEDAMLKFNLAEYDFPTFQAAIGTEVHTEVDAAADQTGQDVLSVGNISKLTERTLVFYGQDEDGYFILYHFPFCVSTGSFEKVFKHGHTSVACEYNVQADPDTGKLFFAYDMTEVPVS